MPRRTKLRHPFLQAVARSAFPGFILLATPLAAYLCLAQLNLMGRLAGVIELLETAVMFLAGAALCWRLAAVLAEAVIASPHIGPESIDAHLIRLFTRVLGIVGAAGLVGLGAERLGVPVYGIVAGLGVGGLAIALATQATLENLIGGIHVLTDKPIRVGDLCRCGTALGTVEAIGIRSTRLRGGQNGGSALTRVGLAAVSSWPGGSARARAMSW